MTKKYNKKRNSAFLYESVVLALTKAIIAKEKETQKKLVALIKESFSAKSEMAKEKRIIEEVMTSTGVSSSVAEKIVLESRLAYSAAIDKTALFKEQSKFIKQINVVDKNALSGFIKNYRNLANVYRTIVPDESIKNRVLLEEKVVSFLSAKETSETPVVLDNIAYGKFIKSYNETYGNVLKEDQIRIIQNYIMSFSDEGVGLKLSMNEAIGSLKKELLLLNEKDNDLKGSDVLGEAIKTLESFSSKPIDEEMIKMVFNLQDFVHEAK